MFEFLDIHGFGLRLTGIPFPGALMGLQLAGRGLHERDINVHLGRDIGHGYQSRLR